MFNADKLLMGLIGGSAMRGSLGGGTMGERLIGGAAGKMLSGRRGRKNRKRLIKYGALAAVGALAYTAYKKYQDKQAGGTGGVTDTSGGNFAGGTSPANMTGQPAKLSGESSFFLGSVDAAKSSSGPGAPVAADSQGDPDELQVPAAFMPAGETEQAELSLTLVRAMIAAASCDGYFDETEKARVLARVEEADFSPEEHASLEREIQRPISLDALAQAARTPQIATEIYVASRMAIEVDSETERRYLHKLAERLQLEPRLIKEIDRELGA